MARRGATTGRRYRKPGSGGPPLGVDDLARHAARASGEGAREQENVMRRGMVAVGLIGAGAAAGWLVRARASDPAWIRGFVTHRFNPVVTHLGLTGGRRSPWAILEHVGRTTGMVYRTPVLPKISDDHAWIPLPYGTEVNWLRNVRAAGHCRMQVHATTYDMDEPALVAPEDRPDLPEVLRRRLAERGDQYLRLHVLASQPGTLDAALSLDAERSLDADPVATG
jgi:deazaflavin-dependent oxidoreductase (nitroreductase family)